MTSIPASFASLAQWYAGTIDEFRIYNRALDAAEIWALFYPGADVPSSDPCEPVRLSVPNPFPAGSPIRLELDQPSPVRLEVYDVLGNRVRLLTEGVLGISPHFVTWDATDDHGRRLGSSVFFLRATIGSQHVGRKIIMVR